MNVDRKAFESALRSVIGAVSTRPGIPCLTGVRVGYDGGTEATITMTDLETSASATVEAHGAPVEALIPAKMLQKVVKAMYPGTPGAQITITADGNPHAGAGHASVGNLRIRLLPLDDFPKLAPAEGPSITVPLATFAETFLGVEAAASGDSARPILTGVKLEAVNGTLTMVATDSYRLHVGTVRFGTADDGSAVDHATIWAAHGIVGELKRERTRCKKLGATVHIVLGESEVAVTFPNGTTIRARTIEGDYPRWEALIPKGTPEAGTVRFDNPDLIDTVNLVGIAASDTTPVRFDLNGAVIVKASSPDLGDAEATVESGTWNGEELALAYNPRYLLDALAASGATSLEVRSPLKPLVMRGENVTALIMPVRLPAAA